MARTKRINIKQLRALYWPQWRNAEKTLVAAGLSKSEAEEKRKQIHISVTGSDCSSKDLTNTALDAVLKKFAAIANPQDGKRQADLADGPCKRLRFAIDQKAKAMGLDAAYVSGIAAQMRYPTNLETCDQRQLRNILIALDTHTKRN